MYLIYTDGSCLGNPGPGGWASIVRSSESGAQLVGNDEFVFMGGEKMTTNNAMELTAVIKSLQWLWEKYAGKAWVWSEDRQHAWLFAEGETTSLLSVTIPVPVTIVTDSTYVKLGITERIVTWKKRQWRRAKGGKLVENIALWKQLDALTHAFPHLDWNRTKAHAGNTLNERVDQLARNEAEKFL